MVALPRKRVGCTQQRGVQFHWLFTLAKYQVGGVDTPFGDVVYLTSVLKGE